MKKVIIIEDSPTFCNMLGKKLEAKGWKTILCYNYRDGLKAVRESSEWDVVISDMRLGNDNGIDLLEWMRSNGYQNPFIIMTSYDESMSAVRTMKLGAEDYIPKKLLLDVVYTPIRDKIAISCMLRQIHEFSSHAIRHGLYIKNRKRLFCP